jgi:hypothetical protein
VVVGAVQATNGSTIALEIVRMRDMSATLHRMNALGLKGLTIGDDAVVSAEGPAGCVAMTLADPVRVQPCTGDPLTKLTRVAGTSIRYDARIGDVTYSR